MQPPIQTDTVPVLTVSELNQAVKQGLEAAFPLVYIQGEISNLARPASGHLYFSLKDPRAQVRCALFRARQKALGCTPRDGLQVLVRARVTLYEPRGDYQLLVEHIEEAGEGVLRQAFEALKRKLASEGLFDQERKKPLPRLPRRIGVITSPSGAVVHDIITTLRRRFPALPVRLYPVAVQGEQAVPQLLQALAAASARRDCDVLLVARGGGSLEDLQAFNDEAVARALAVCPLPIVCGVGHETDVTIADFVADVRAPTPTAAAELLSPDRREWLAQLADRARRLVRQMETALNQRGQQLDWLGRRLIHPRARLAQLAQHLGNAVSRLGLGARFRLQSLSRQAQFVETRLQKQSPLEQIRGHRTRHDHLQTALRHAARHRLLALEHRLEKAAGTLDTLSPLATLARGYALVQLPDGTILRRAEDANPGDTLRTRLAHGQVLSIVTDTTDET